MIASPVNIASTLCVGSFDAPPSIFSSIDAPPAAAAAAAAFSSAA